MHLKKKKNSSLDLPSGPEAKTLYSHAASLGSIPSQGIKFHMTQLRVHMCMLSCSVMADSLRPHGL